MSRVHVDLDRCQGHGRCALLAPEVFDVADDAKVEILARGELTGALHGHAVEAALSCPESAITVD